MSSRVLTVEQVAYVKASNKTQKALAKELGVGRGTILRVVHDDYAPPKTHTFAPDGAEWRVIPGFPQYEASRDGRVRSLRTGRVLKQRANWKGYMRLGIWVGEKRSVECKVHRLIALAFIPNPERKPEVNHIDGDTKHNHASNLEWVTSQENYAHAVALGRHSAETNPNKIQKLTPSDREECKRRHAAGESIRALAREFSMNWTSMRRAIKGQPKQKYVPRPGVSRTAKSREEARQRRLARLSSTSSHDQGEKK